MEMGFAVSDDNNACQRYRQKSCSMLTTSKYYQYSNFRTAVTNIGNIYANFMDALCNQYQLGKIVRLLIVHL